MKYVTHLFLSAFALMTTPMLALANGFQVGEVVPSLTVFTENAVGSFEYFGEGRPNLTITLAPTEDFNLAVTIEDTGWLDDSVFGQLNRYVVRYNGDGWEILTVESLNSCYRTETRDWQEGPCP